MFCSSLLRTLQKRILLSFEPNQMRLESDDVTLSCFSPPLFFLKGRLGLGKLFLLVHEAIELLFHSQRLLFSQPGPVPLAKLLESNHFAMINLVSADRDRDEV